MSSDQAVTATFDKVTSLEPDFSVRQFNQLYPFKLASDRANYLQGLQLAGVPEG